MKKTPESNLSPELPPESYNPFKKQAIVVAELIEKGFNNREATSQEGVLYNRELDLLRALGDEAASNFPKNTPSRVDEFYRLFKDVEAKNPNLKKGISQLIDLFHNLYFMP